MNTTIILRDTAYLDEENQVKLARAKDALMEKTQVQAKHDGQLGQPKTPGEYTILATNGIETEVRSLIDANKARYLPHSGEQVANAIEQEAGQKIKELKKEVHGLEAQLGAAKAEVEGCKPDIKHMRLRKWILPALIFIPLAEGYMSYDPFRHAHFPPVASIIASIAVACTVGFSTHFAGGWLKAAGSNRQYIQRLLIVLAPAAAGFAALAWFRASAYSDIIDLHIGGTNAAVANNSSVSAIGIFCISLLLFWVGVFLSSHFFRTKGERLQEQAFEEASEKLAGIEKQIRDVMAEIRKTEDNKTKEITLAHRRYEYAKDIETGLVNFAQQLAENYKKYNISSRTDSIPSFYSDKTVFTFAQFFNL